MQKVNNVPLTKLLQVYSHPSAALFRALELKQIFEACKEFSFKGPSLDIGSGDGLISSILFNNKFTYGVDNGEAKDYQESIKENRYGKVLLESADKMSIPDNSINFAFSNSVLEHIPNLDGVFSEVSRVMKSEGYFVFTTPSEYFRSNISINDHLNNIGLGWINKKYSTMRNKGLNHYNLHDHKYYKKNLKKYGFEITDYSYAISDKALKLWDCMAIKIKLLKLLGLDVEKTILKDNLVTIKHLYQTDIISKQNGSNLLIISKKI